MNVYFTLQKFPFLTLLLQILGGRMHGPSPHFKFFGGQSAQSPLCLHPCSLRRCNSSCFSPLPFSLHSHSTVLNPLSGFVIIIFNECPMLCYPCTPILYFLN